MLLGNPRAVPPPIVVVLAATAAAASGAATPPFVASISGDGATLVTRPIVPVARAAPTARSSSGPCRRRARRARSACCPANGGTVALRGRVLAGADTLAVTRRAAGGSPTGAPTGPIVYAGKFSL